MLEVLLDVIVAFLAIRGVWKLLHGVMLGMAGDSAVHRASAPPARPPAQGVQMARDPVCGTYVVPDRAVSMRNGSDVVYFCSSGCRDKFRAKTA